MRQYAHLEEYSATITAIGPVFIGSGIKINKKEYVFDRRRNAAVIFDIDKLIMFFEKKGLLNKYIDFQLDPKQKSLDSFFYENRLREQDYQNAILAIVKHNDEHIENHALKDINIRNKILY